MDNDTTVRSHRLSMQVERYHTWPKVHRQTVGEHVAQVLRIYRELFGTPRVEVYEHVLYHDAPEMRIGDLPFSGDYSAELRAAKAVVERRVIADMKLPDPQLTADELRRVKLCDMMDCYEWGCHEMRLGNTFGQVVSDNVVQPIMAIAGALGCTHAVRRHMTSHNIRP